MIPKIIFQTWISKEQNDSIDVLRRTWIEKNSDFEYVYFDDDDILDFLALHFDERVNKCYNRIVNGSLKADFFRYCVLYINGGLYIDIDISCEKSLIEHLNFDEIHFVTATDHCKVQSSDRIYQGFLGGEVKCPVFNTMIEHICTCIEQNRFKSNLFDLSGPVIFSKKLKEYMNNQITETKQKCTFLKELTFVNPITKDLFVIIEHDISKEKLVDNNTIIATAQNKMDRKSNPHYFINRSVYKKGYYV